MEELLESVLADTEFAAAAADSDEETQMDEENALLE
jgi:hypothetical protein